MESQAESLRLAGNQHFIRHEYELAIDLYTQSLEIMPTAFAFSNRAMAYLKVNSFDNALSDSEAALQMEPNNMKAQTRKARALYGLGRIDEAKAAILIAYEADPNLENASLSFDWNIPRRPHTSTMRYDAKKAISVHEFLLTGAECSLPSGGVEVNGQATPFDGMKSDKKITLFDRVHNYLNKCHSTIELVYFKQLPIDQKVMEVLRGADPVCWTGGVYFQHVEVPARIVRSFVQLFTDGAIQPHRLEFINPTGGLTGEVISQMLINTPTVRDASCIFINDCKSPRFGTLSVEAVLSYVHHQPDEKKVASIRVLSMDSSSFNGDVRELYNKLHQKLVADTRERPFQLTFSCPKSAPLPVKEGRFDYNWGTDEGLTMRVETRWQGAPQPGPECLDLNRYNVISIERKGVNLRETLMRALTGL